MDQPAKRVYTFGDFRLDHASNLLIHKGQPVPLTPKVFDTLLLLVENSGRLVDKDQFMRRLWPDTFVGDDALAQNIHILRKVLEETANGQEYIATIPKRGYRFVADVHAGPQDGEDWVIASRSRSQVVIEKTEGAPGEALQALPAPAKERSSERRKSLRFAGAIAALLVLVLSAGYAAWRQLRTPVQQSPNDRVMLAVLPFDNLTGDVGQDYISDGLTEEMITQLAELQPNRLGVIARTSVMSYKHGDKSIPRVARQLGVDYIVEGSLRQSAGRVRVTAQLIQVKDQTHVWAQDYDRALGDMLTMERQVSASVAREIQLQLTSQQRADLARPRTVDPEAHELYLKGRFYWNKRTPDGFYKALSYFEAAIEKDPNYAEAYAGLADAYRFSMNNDSPDVVMPKAKEAAEKALAIDPNLPEAHASLGLIAPYYDWDWDTARRELQRAIELNPNYALAHDWYADGYLAPMGKLDESLAELRTAQRLDPLSPVILADIGKTLYFARRYDEAIAQLRTVQEMDPTAYPAARWIWTAYIEKGMFDEALDVIEKEKPYVPETFHLCDLAYTHARMGHSEEARRLLAQFLKIRGNEDPGGPALVYLALGDKGRAFEWLEKAFAYHSNFMSSLRVLPVYDPIRNDPRFIDLERRTKLIP